MKLLRQLIVAVLAVISLAGCLQVEKLVKLKPDGSGTLEETVFMNKGTIQSMKQMAGGPSGGGKKSFEILDQAKLKDAAKQMGEGVTFVSATKISNEQGEGFKAIYAFKDINKLKIDQNPASAMKSTGGPKQPDEKKKQEPVGFRFAKGSPAELTITMPKPEATPRKEQPEGAEEMAMQMIRQMLKDMRIVLAVEVAGEITETNAEYREGSRVTLLDMDMNKLFADPEKFKSVVKANPPTLQESKALLKSVEGVKIETAPEVKIKFQ